MKENIGAVLLHNPFEGAKSLVNDAVVQKITDYGIRLIFCPKITTEKAVIPKLRLFSSTGISTSFQVDSPIAEKFLLKENIGAVLLHNPFEGAKSLVNDAVVQKITDYGIRLIFCPKIATEKAVIPKLRLFSSTGISTSFQVDSPIAEKFLLKENIGAVLLHNPFEGAKSLVNDAVVQKITDYGIRLIFCPKITTEKAVIPKLRLFSSTGISTFNLLLYPPVGISFLDVVAFVVVFLAAGDCDFHLGQSHLVDKDGKRHERQTFQGRIADELPDFLFMQQQLSRTQRIYVEPVALFVRADVHSIHDDLVALDLGVALF